MSSPQNHLSGQDRPFNLVSEGSPNASEPKHTSFHSHGSNVVTCLVLSGDRIITGSDDHSILIYSRATGHLLHTLKGHEGGIWALAVNQDTIVSGSTDRSLRVWNLAAGGKCTHTFQGHTSTIRALVIVQPESIDVHRDGVTVKETWPERPLIVTGSRDHTLRVWKFPLPGEPELHQEEADDLDEQRLTDENPYHLRLLEGHEHAVRAIAAQGRTLASGSYDCTVRIWDIITGEIKWVLVGHTQKVYSVVLDLGRNQACSGSMDGTVRVWNLENGQCQHTLTGHTSLVGLLGLSPSYLVSAAADSTLRIWDPDTGELRHTLAAHTGAITCFQHDEFKVLSGSDGNLKMWNVRDGTVVRDLLTGITGVWQVVFEGRWCVAASNRNDTTVLDVWDFGNESDEDWLGEPPSGLYDEDIFSDDGDCEDEDDPKHKGMRNADEDDDQEQADIDAMDQDLLPSETESIADIELDHSSREGSASRPLDDFDIEIGDDREELEGGEGVEASRWAPGSKVTTSTSRGSQLGRTSKTGTAAAGTSRRLVPPANGAGPSSSNGVRLPPTNDETPTRPRIRNGTRRR